MREIRRLKFFQQIKTKSLMPFIENCKNEHNMFLRLICSSPLRLIHDLLLQRHKFLDESFVSENNNSSEGLITVSYVVGEPNKLIISELYYDEKKLDTANDLINFVISDYGEKGISAFYATIDQNYNSLIQIFLTQCGFRQCSNEQIWKVNKKSFKKSKNITYRRFKNSDLEDISNIYNDSLITHFRPTMERTKKEFSEFTFSGLTYTSDYRYVIEDKSSKRIIGYFLISTSDNKDFEVDFNYSDGYEVDFDGIMHFAIREILKRKRHFNLYLKIKNYLRTGETQQEYMSSGKYSCVQTKLMLVKDFYKPIKEFEHAKCVAGVLIK